MGFTKKTIDFKRRESINSHWGFIKIFPKRAFTMAEVLITLDIIGTVAAITILDLIKNY